MLMRAPGVVAFVFALVGCDSHPSAPTAGSAKTQILLTPLDPHLNRGESLELHARVLTGESVEIRDAVVEWSTSDPGVAVINSSGVAHGVRLGTATIRARVGNVVAQAPLVVADPFKDTPSYLSLELPQVLLPGEVGQLTGGVYNRFRERLIDSVVTWTNVE
jgi:hypothetical protein